MLLALLFPAPRTLPIFLRKLLHLPPTRLPLSLFHLTVPLTLKAVQPPLLIIIRALTV